MEKRLLTPTKWRGSNLNESLPMPFVSTRSLDEVIDRLEIDLENIKEENESDDACEPEFEETCEASETQSAAGQLVKIKDTNLVYRRNPQTSFCDNASIASQSKESQSMHINTDSGYSGTTSGISESLLDGNDQIHPEVSGEECKTSASSYSCESWKIGIQTTSTPFKAQKLCSDNQNVYKLGTKSAEILQFGNELSQKHQDSFLDKQNKAIESGNGSSCLQASAKAGRDKLDVMNNMKVEAEPGCSYQITKYSSIEIISERRQHDYAVENPFDVTYSWVEDCGASSQQHSAILCMKKHDGPEEDCSSKMVEFPLCKKVSKTRGDKKRGTSRTSRVLTSQGRRRSGKFVSLAEAMQKFQTATPKRFRTMPNSCAKLVASKRCKVTERELTRDQSSYSSNKKRVRPGTEAELRPRAEQDNAAVADSSGKRKNPAGTGAKTFVFRAKPMPDFKSPKIAKSRKPLTNPQSPLWARKKKQ